MVKYEFIVIGVGPAGYAVALRGVYIGKQMCLREHDRAGKTGVYNGTLSFNAMCELSNRDSDIN